MTIRITFFVLLFLGSHEMAHATTPHRALNTISEAIRVMQPKIKASVASKYAKSIYRATKRYNVEPGLLLAITQQESGFRTGLPEGRAGEIGICQILKRWLRDPRFISEFGRRTKRDLEDPHKSFYFAAWILNIKQKQFVAKDWLPFWTYYNAKSYPYRLKYYNHVNRKIKKLRVFAIRSQQKRKRKIAATASTVLLRRAKRNRPSTRPRNS